MTNVIRFSGVPLEIGLWNTLLSVYIENHYDFEPLEFLKNLWENSSAEPNKVKFSDQFTIKTFFVNLFLYLARSQKNLYLLKCFTLKAPLQTKEMQNPNLIIFEQQYKDPKHGKLRHMKKIISSTLVKRFPSFPC